MNAHRAEGVIRFESLHRKQPLDPRAHGEPVRTLAGWHQVLARLGVLGRDPARYGGLAYGNISARLGSDDEPRGLCPFIITGTQTAGREALTIEDFCVVERWDAGANRVESFGPVPPSSESLTHAALYDAAPSVRVVFHAHAPAIWHRARRLGLPTTRDDVANGTPGMAAEVRRMYGEAAPLGIMVMGGHEDGVVSFGADARAAGNVLVDWLARALEPER